MNSLPANGVVVVVCTELAFGIKPEALRDKLALVPERFSEALEEGLAVTERACTCLTVSGKFERA